ncbi:MAG: 4Fe-4S dicluster domain-containing protein [Proteobacteria bacterium]|nr:4Fe-4S dicluster domain-containing protein [Pseudomonadota bacterium]MBU1386313.1 4Fe-4S dicluster domain-containing protein [Pseudomonadota bacterium]MBU1543939.1 4Fe-4S dicluster domain-containing protein [Pseudomonadota bacterium]MBU2430152.1 4Fe-4S dicluster domain-containing protein [Pseudomonadota bacterium]MBU2482264.1 4Fe-4S dicluster domain-containing protein [Pseudomonadota bacterium]
MTSGISRRAFLKTSAVTAGSLVASGTLISKNSELKAAQPASEEPLVTLIDISKCIGCEACVEACREVNADQFPDPEKPFPKMYPTSTVPVEDWSDKTDVTDRLTPYNWLFIQQAQVMLDGDNVELNIPRRCMHCENPPCVKLCPWGALKQETNGLSRIDPDLCLGGAKCKTVCPWEIPQRQTGVGLYLDILPAFAGNGVMYKCNRCYQRLEKGQVPACIEVCPENVQIIGPRTQILEQAHALAKEMNGYIYGETENGGTHTIYVSPVPFDQLNQGIDTGKGKPHFQKVKNMMADGTLLAKAMIIAPFAGLFAAFGKYYLASREDKK